jgi:SusD family.
MNCTKLYWYSLFLGISLGIVTACDRSKLLDRIPFYHGVETLEDMQMLLDNEKIMAQTHGLAIISADEIICRDEFLPSLSAVEYNAYLWNKKIYAGQETIADWDLPYTQVYYANEILQRLKKIAKSAINETHYENLEGAALFIRAYAFFNLAQIFAPPYDSSAPVNPYGIPLHLKADITQTSRRSTLQETYDQILSDLKQSVLLLPEIRDKQFPNRPCRASAHALLARVYLSMRLYDMALLHADECIKLSGNLLDFNDIDSTLRYPFEPTNEEVLYQSRIFSSCSIASGLETGLCAIDSQLYRLYDRHDLRRGLFFRTGQTGIPTFRGSFYNSAFAFTGLTTAEAYLIRAEGRLKCGYAELALLDINLLRQKRWRHGFFEPVISITADSVLALIEDERRRELVLRGQRWTDLRRKNTEGIGITLTRRSQDRIYELPPGDPRYVLPIPDLVIQVTGMLQNPR